MQGAQIRQTTSGWRMSHIVAAEGFDDNPIELTKSKMGVYKLSQNGQPVERVGRGKKAVFKLVKDDGSKSSAQLKARFLDFPGVVVDGKKYNVVEPLSGLEWAVVAAPMVCIIGGMIGALLGVLATTVNLKVIRLDQPKPVRYLLMALITAIAIGGYVLAASLLNDQA